MNNIEKELRKYIDKEKSIVLPRFFKTSKGEYGEGDIFLGIVVPNIRKVAIKYTDISLEDIKELIYSKYHEVRLCGFLILTYKYPKYENKEELVNFYITNLKQANNWDIVDLTCYKILGEYLLKNKDKIDILYSLSNSSNLWEQRVSIVSTMAFIRNNEYKYTIDICNRLINHKHDLIHKACGWMLREVGKRDMDILIEYLDKNSKIMPRVMLRYSIEKLDNNLKEKYLKK